MELHLEQTTVIKQFAPEDRQEYRIPGICVTEKGTVLLCAEKRAERLNDWAAIDISVMRSADGGASFTEQILTASSAEAPITWNNPVWIADGEIIHLLYCQNYERLYHRTSTDDGVTFSAPEDITDTLKAADYLWNVCAVGPGHGLRAKSGVLYASVWLANGAVNPENPRNKAHWPSVAGIIYSRDRGKTWAFGDTVRDLTDGNETCIAETADGNILLNVRHRGKPMLRALSVYAVAEGICRPRRFASALPDPMCFGGTVNLPNGTVLFANCVSDFTAAGASVEEVKFRPRTNLCIHASENDGNTWQSVLCVDEIGGYSDIAADGDTVYLFYEQSVNCKVSRLLLKKYRYRPE